MYFRISDITASNSKDIKIISESGMDFDQIPDAIFELPNLERLHLCNSHIKTIPNKISKLTKLKDLFLEHNEIGSISTEIVNLKKLKNLRLYGNKIQDIRPLCGIPSLQKLELGRNLLEKLPEELGNLKNLKHLDLGNIFYTNKVNYLPETLEKLSNLEYISLCGAELSTLGSFGKLTSLNKILVRNSGVMALEIDFSSLKELSVLDLTNNFLTAIPESVIFASNLKEIYLDGNPINNFPAGIKKLTKLKYLGLASAHSEKSKLDYLRVFLPNTRIVVDKGFFVESHESEISK